MFSVLENLALKVFQKTRLVCKQRRFVYEIVQSSVSQWSDFSFLFCLSLPTTGHVTVLLQFSFRTIL